MPVPVHRSAPGRTPLRGLVTACVLLAGSLAALLAAAPPAVAETVQWSVAPRATDDGARPNYGFVLDPGAVVDDAVVVTNLGATPLALGLYAADGFTTDAGELDVLPTGTASTDLGTWVQLATSAVELAPGERVEVPFTLTVPADAAAGDHSGAIVTSLVSDAGATGVSVDRRLGVRVHALVSGELTAGMAVSDLTVDFRPSLVPFAPGSAVVGFTLTNTGNTRVAADQVVRLTGPFGLGSHTTAPARTPELLAGASVPVELTVPDVPALGALTAEVALVPAAVGASDVPADPVTAASSGTAVGPTSVAVLGVLLLLLGWWWLRRRQRARREPAHTVTPAPAPDLLQPTGGTPR
ncbi:DUF916 domain-containing protein [Modestobacter roseus]|uniref:DUF916 domain-containing protein n=1 Tax=Modestobacter roseus TaxID=1181884 RepID=UPI001298225A|nr:DUF916 domain-containing protein [Modestobacter roseus]MQA34463.1 DUF916 domain-containing protein [Modestobacter roseus]